MMNLIYLMDLIQFQLFKIISYLSQKKHEKHEKHLTENPPVKIYTNKLKNRIVFKIKQDIN